MSIIEQLKVRTEPLCVREVADLLGVVESTVQRWVRNRELPAIRVRIPDKTGLYVPATHN